MSRFKRLSLNEAAQEFPLLNAEAQKALKGGCSMCEEWRKQSPGIRIYTQEEYFRMCEVGTWTIGAVCGIGGMVGAEVVVDGNEPPSSYCGQHMWPFPDQDCLYCYWDSMNFCPFHEEYFSIDGQCYKCEPEQIYGYLNLDYENAQIYGSDYSEWKKAFIGNVVVNTYLRDQPFAQEFFMNYWEARGDMKLGDWSFSLIAKAAASTGVDYRKGTMVEIGGQTYYKVLVNFYEISDWRNALGTATMYYDQYGKPVGVKDRYDFDSKPTGERNAVAEYLTRTMNEWGHKYEGEAFNISYGIHD